MGEYAVLRLPMPDGRYRYEVRFYGLVLETVGSTLEAAASIDAHIGLMEREMHGGYRP